ncbi:hypothetical protein EXE58_14010 [Nocardioides seonyuensis]|uniref:Uncharacterized protein n=1 Tax=Nocardioides seonyuensis TaxID=2518371 RepID=A0A4P7IIF1_9ACTN|nr:hypothetical protein [Nocardioides seonyuensis]QBX56470.1 hypothetical protein EXE58_14010 [Nocardioides seonyuensis]
MGIFASRARRATAACVRARTSIVEEQVADEQTGLPRRLEVVGEALLAGSDPVLACSVVGRDLARDGLSAEEAIEALRATWWAVRGCDPDFGAVAALMVAWSDTTLGYLHQLSCVDPMTGLASQAHLRSRLTDLYRARVRPNDTHALVVAELPDDDADPSEEVGDHFTRAMRVTRMGECARTVFVRDEMVARLGAVRVGMLVERDERLGRRVKVLRTLLASIDPQVSSRVWIEGLPGSNDTAAVLLDELARR